MRFTNVPQEGRAAHEPNLPGVTVCRDACEAPDGWTWAKGAGGTNDNQAGGIAAYDDGSVAVTGLVSGTANFGDVFIPEDFFGLFVAKYDAEGNILWVKLSNECYNCESRGIAMHPDGSATLVGNFSYSANIGGMYLTGTGQTDIFVARICPE